MFLPVCRRNAFHHLHQPPGSLAYTLWCPCNNPVALPLLVNSCWRCDGQLALRVDQHFICSTAHACRERRDGNTYQERGSGLAHLGTAVVQSLFEEAFVVCRESSAECFKCLCTKLDLLQLPGSFKPLPRFGRVASSKSTQYFAALLRRAFLPGNFCAGGQCIPPSQQYPAFHLPSGKSRCKCIYRCSGAYILIRLLSSANKGHRNQRIHGFIL